MLILKCSQFCLKPLEVLNRLLTLSLKNIAVGTYRLFTYLTFHHFVMSFFNWQVRDITWSPKRLMLEDRGEGEMILRSVTVQRSSTTVRNV